MQCASGETCQCQGTDCNVNGVNPAPASGNYSTIWQRLVWLNWSGGFAGATDWRIPKVNQVDGEPRAAELETILRLPYPFPGYAKPCTWPEFNTSYTPGCTVTSCSCTQSSSYSSSSTLATDTNTAWGVDFSDGYVGTDGKPSYYGVRAVRGGS